MPEANSAPILSNPPSRLPTLAPDPAHKPKFVDRLCESLRSRHYSPRPEFPHRLLHLTHVDLFRLKIPSPLAGEDGGEGDQNGNAHSAIPLPHICWKRVTIFEPSRNSWGTLM